MISHCGFVLLQKIPKCHLLAATGAVSLAINTDKVATAGKAECQAARGGAGSTQDAEGKSLVVGGVTIQLGQWNRQTTEEHFNSSYVWKPT